VAEVVAKEPPECFSVIQHTIDEKNNSRLTLPAPFRQPSRRLIGARLRLVLYAYPVADWTKAIERSRELDL